MAQYAECECTGVGCLHARGSSEHEGAEQGRGSCDTYQQVSRSTYLRELTRFYLVCRGDSKDNNRHHYHVQGG